MTGKYNWLKRIQKRIANGEKLKKRELRLMRALRHSAKFAFALPLLGSLPIDSFAASSKSAKAMWVWETANIIHNSSAAEKLFAFCATPPGANGNADAGINTLYFAAHGGVNGTAQSQQELHSFLRAAHARGLKVEYLDGAPEWATTGAAYAEQQVDRVIAFNKQGKDASEKFDGVQYDVEPYLLANWMQKSTWLSYIGLLKECEYRVHASGLPFGVCIPRWYDVTPGPGYLLEVQSTVDYVAVMDYVNNPAGMISDAKTEVENASKLHKKVILGVETMDIQPASVSFHDLGWSKMDESLKAVDHQYASASGFAGVAIHHYETYAALAKFGLEDHNVAYVQPNSKPVQGE